MWPIWCNGLAFILIVLSVVSFSHSLMGSIGHRDRCHIAFIINLWILWGSTFFLVLMEGRRRLCMMLILWPLWKMQNFMFHESRPMSFHPLSYSFHVVKSTWYYHSMAFACWQTFVIANPIWVDLVSWVVLSCGVVAMVGT